VLPSSPQIPATARALEPSVGGRRGRARRWLAVVAAVLVLVGVACSDDSSSSSSTTDDTAVASTSTTVVNTSSLDDVEVSADMAAEPVVTFDPAFAGSEPQSRTIVEGDGATLATGDWVSLDYVVIAGATGTQLATTWGGNPETLALNESLQADFRDALVGKPIGSRVAVTTDSEDGWVIFVIDIGDLVPKEASGAPVTPPAGLPTVAIVDGAPTVTIPEGAEPPTELVVEPLIEGSGPVIESGQLITAQYVGAKWSDGSVFGSSWADGLPLERPVGEGQLIPGMDTALVGQTVGSRVLIVIPPALGYGAEGNSSAGISGTETLVFVVDILAAH
jgi:peptidylprolyl isomerase